MKKIKVVDMIKKDDLVFFLERKEKVNWGIFFFILFGIFISVATTAFFFIVLIYSFDKIERVFSLIAGIAGLGLSFLLILLTFSTLDRFTYTTETWRVEPYDLCKEEFDSFIARRS